MPPFPAPSPAPSPADVFLNLGTELIDIYVGQENTLHRIHKRLLETRLPRFTELHLKDNTTNSVTLSDLKPEIFDTLLKWLFLAFYDITYGAADSLVNLYGFAESLGENILMDDLMMSLYIKYRQAERLNEPSDRFPYALAYEVTKPGSKLRDFAARFYVWDLLHLESAAWNIRGRVCNGWELLREIANQTEEMRNDMFSVSLVDSTPPYRQGVCKFHTHEGEDAENCIGLLGYPHEGPSRGLGGSPTGSGRNSLRSQSRPGSRGRSTSPSFMISQSPTGSRGRSRSPSFMISQSPTGFRSWSASPSFMRSQSRPGSRGRSTSRSRPRTPEFQHPPFS